MKNLYFSLLAFSLSMLLSACTALENPFEEDQGNPEDVPEVTSPISISSPTPEATLTSVSLTPEQQSYVDSSNEFAFRCLTELYKEGGTNIVFSPLSAQYALAMVVNGASGDTASEITRALGFGPDLNALNDYCHSLLNQLPALDPDVVIKLADALVVDNRYPLLPDYEKCMEEVYYAPVEYMSFSDRKHTVDRINEWAYRNTDGLIFPLLEEEDLDQVLAAIMNALYFKAPWAETFNGTMFLPESTKKDRPFYEDGGGTVNVDMMPTTGYFGYAQLDGYRMLEIPYADKRFAMYVLLPDDVGKQGLKQLMDILPKESWKKLISSLTYRTEVHLDLPKFETSSSFRLVQTLQALGIRKAFGRDAVFDRMFSGKEEIHIGNVIQKAHIQVTEWGTEAAAVTVVLMAGSSGIVPPHADFIVDHPFVYVIAERSSGTILFDGIFSGK